MTSIAFYPATVKSTPTASGSRRLWSVWFIWLVWFNQINEINQTNNSNQLGFTFHEFCHS